MKTLNLKAAMHAAVHHLPASLTLAELAQAYEIAHPCHSGPRLRKWLDAIGQQSAWAVDAGQLHAAAEAMLSAGYKPSSVNRDLSAIGSLFKWARARRYTPTGFVSPTVGIPRYTESVRHVEVTPAELDALRLMAKLEGGAFEVFVHLLIDTGARKSELLERRWADVDIAGRQILLKTSKTGKPRYLFFTEATAQRLQAMPRADAGRLVFEGRGGAPNEFRKPWARAVEAMRRPDLRMHDIRHVAAASLLRSGVSLGVAAQVLGHSSLILQRRYGHLETDALRAAQEQRWRA